MHIDRLVAEEGLIGCRRGDGELGRGEARRRSWAFAAAGAFARRAGFRRCRALPEAVTISFRTRHRLIRKMDHAVGVGPFVDHGRLHVEAARKHREQAEGNP